MRIVINGQSYSDLSQLPPDVRQQYERILGGLADRDGNGIPDILEMGSSSLVHYAATRPFATHIRVPGRSCLVYLGVLLVGVLMGLVAAAGAWMALR
jgi:hypothetical protein